MNGERPGLDDLICDLEVVDRMRELVDHDPSLLRDWFPDAFVKAYLRGADVLVDEPSFVLVSLED